MTRLSLLCLLLWTHVSWTYLGRAENSLAASNAQAASPLPAEQGKVLKRSYFFKEADRQMEYALYVPTGYRPEHPAPLLVLLHGLGSNPFQIIRYAGMIEQAEKRGYIVVAPMGYNVAGWYGSQGPGRDFPVKWMQPPNSPPKLGELSEKDVLNVLEEARAQFRTDPARTYLMGHSMGGGGTLYLGAKHSKPWAALAALSPAYLADAALLKNLQHTPVYVAQGDADVLVKVDKTRALVADLKEIGVPFQYDEIKGGDHLFSIAANAALMEKMFDFFDAHQK